MHQSVALPTTPPLRQLFHTGGNWRTPQNALYCEFTGLPKSMCKANPFVFLLHFPKKTYLAENLVEFAPRKRRLRVKLYGPWEAAPIESGYPAATG
jgi:hypothetical protein